MAANNLIEEAPNCVLLHPWRFDSFKGKWYKKAHPAFNKFTVSCATNPPLLDETENDQKMEQYYKKMSEL